MVRSNERERSQLHNPDSSGPYSNVPGRKTSTNTIQGNARLLREAEPLCTLHVLKTPEALKRDVVQRRCVT